VYFVRLGGSVIGTGKRKHRRKSVEPLFPLVGGREDSTERSGGVFVERLDYRMILELQKEASERRARVRVRWGYRLAGPTDTKYKLLFLK
jgi:hypothetical protein